MRSDSCCYYVATRVEKERRGIAFINTTDIHSSFNIQAVCQSTRPAQPQDIQHCRILTDPVNNGEIPGNRVFMPVRGCGDNKDPGPSSTPRFFFFFWPGSGLILLIVDRLRSRRIHDGTGRIISGIQLIFHVS